MTLGATFYVWHQMLRRPRRFVMEHGYWGSEFSEAELREALGMRSAELDRSSLN
jgi:carbamoyltransferase